MTSELPLWTAQLLVGTEATRIGTHAARPAATSVPSGWQYYETDTRRIFQSDHVVWSAVGTGLIDVADVAGLTAGVSSLAKSGSAGLTGDVTLTGGANVTLTQAGQDISIAAAAGGSGIGAKLFDSTLGADTASIDTGAAGIAGGYDSLAVYMILRTSEAVTISTTNVTCNNDTGANYDREQVQATDTTVAGGGALAGTSWVIACSGASAQAGAATTVFLLCPGYAQTTFHKTFGGQLAIQDSVAGSSRIVANALRYRSTAAISRMKVAAASGNLKAGSRLLVYGF